MHGDRTDVIRPVAFPNGIADAEGRHACVRDRAGHLVAIDLERGSILWRSSEPLRPLLAAPDEAIATTESFPAVCVGLRFDGAGAIGWRSGVLPIPEWAFAGNASLTLAAEMHGATITIRWSARARYRGGAAPSREILEQAARDDHGAFAVDRGAGRVTPAPAPASRPAEPDAILEQRIGTRTYTLVPESSGTVLRAADATTGAQLWQVRIDEGPPRGPRALRM